MAQCVEIITHFHNELIKWLKTKSEYLSDNLLPERENHFQTLRATLPHDNTLITSTTIFVSIHTPLSSDLTQHCLCKSHTLALETE